jgi:broad specificity phosphatase PhoE
MTGWPDVLPHRLILVRHGQTVHTAEFRVSGAGFRPEPELDADGERQAHQIGRHLAQQEAPIDEVLVSPMLRAQQTAGAILAELGGRGMVLADDWAEAHFGDWEGLAVPDIVERYPGAWESMLDDPDRAPPGGESLTQVRQRVLAAWDRQAAPGRTTLVVTHLTPIRVVLAHALSTPQSAFSRMVALPGSVTIVDRWADGGAAVLAMGERPDGVGPMRP